MKCPKCPGKLEKKTIENIEVDVCFVCEGVWFDAGELEEVIKRDSKDFKFIDVGREELDGAEIVDVREKLDEKTGECPRCSDGTLLIKDTYKGAHEITVDVCPKGHGLWLDGGEISKLRKRGLVNAKDQLDFHLKLLRYMWSKDGFRDFKNRIFRRRHKPQSGNKEEPSQ
jgi:Zn-finger nucleic acid-binding protein